MFRRVSFALALTLVVSACSGPPTKEREQAATALAAARAAEAATYAPDEFAAAEAALKKYDDAVAQRDYREALNDALQARDRAYESARQAAEQKTTLQKQFQTLSTELVGLQKTADARLGAGAVPHLSGQAAERLRTAQHAAPPALQEARSLFDKQDFQGAVARLTPVIEALRRELAPPDAGRRGRSGAK
jgi:hypothetical protein